MVWILNGSFSIDQGNKLIKTSNNKKLLEVNLNIRLGFDIYVTNICKQASKKLSRLYQEFHISWAVINRE